MDNEIKESFIKVLKEIIEGDLSNIDLHSGICRNLKKAIDGYHFVSDNIFDWEYYSGNNAYPITYSGEEGKWQGEQLKLRQSLAQHLLTKLEENTYVL